MREEFFSMQRPTYIGLHQAREVLSEMGIKINERQMKRAADKGPDGQRKLPFFTDPIDGKLKIEKTTLVKIYRNAQINAEKCEKINT